MPDPRLPVSEEEVEAARRESYRHGGSLRGGACFDVAKVPPMTRLDTIRELAARLATTGFEIEVQELSAFSLIWLCDSVAEAVRLLKTVDTMTPEDGRHWLAERDALLRCVEEET